MTGATRHDGPKATPQQGYVKVVSVSVLSNALVVPWEQHDRSNTARWSQGNPAARLCKSDECVSSSSALVVSWHVMASGYTTGCRETSPRDGDEDNTMATTTASKQQIAPPHQDHMTAPGSMTVATWHDGPKATQQHGHAAVV